ncbi:aminotransferase class V-fold PLP-dependent enzyme [Alphaproteobacteria bacterium KMM 3653]|uniref:Aminotransferase class V-fold PLP-dependent enzyme n=1 Tax=Harenicola maris TaxID=2841044 RepID=A0AAP2CX93_9RHOB|nr:aminotransferase class V-fold PLP-dependent enzyme [Harenicola maris]
MSLSNGRSYLAIPGPSVMPDAVLQAMHRAAPNIYSGELPDMMPGIVADLKRVARTEHSVAIYIGNGHAVWEAALANTLSRGDRVLMPGTGSFGHGWADLAERLHITVDRIDFGKHQPVNLDTLRGALAKDTEHTIKAILAVHTDTSTSIKNDIKGMRAVLDDLNHPALLMVDCMASLGCDPFEMDAWGADVMTAGSQKGLMTPPGLGFVFFNDRADLARETADLASSYWDWRPRANPEFFYQFSCGTAPTHHFYGLRAALDIIHGEGIENVWTRHHRLAQSVWAAAEAWGKGGSMALNVSDPVYRSHSVTTLSLGGSTADDLQNWITENTGVTLGIGLGMAEGRHVSPGHFRIGHMGHVNAHMVLGMLGSIDLALKALGVDHGAGAVEAATRSLAG